MTGVCRGGVDPAGVSAAGPRGHVPNKMRFDTHRISTSKLDQRAPVRQLVLLTGGVSSSAEMPYVP